MKSLLNIASTTNSSKVLGPGNRFVIWVQGCPFNCHKCIAKDWIPFQKANLIEIEVLAENIVSQDKISGITISGGEPLMQAGRLSKLLDSVSKKKKLNTIVFTGFSMKELIWKEAHELLERVDVLITGRFHHRKNDNKGLRGSWNQEIHFLTDEFRGQEEYFFTKKRDIEFSIINDATSLIGIPSKDFKW